MTLSPTQLRDAVNAANPGRNWDQACQAFIFQALKASGRAPSHSYDTAKLARLASGTLNTNLAQAQPGDILYFIIGTKDHDAVYLGNGLMASATDYGDVVEQWGTHLKVSHVSTYPGPFAGFAGNGNLGKVDVSGYPVVVKATERQALGILVRARADANTSAAVDAAHNVPAGEVGNFDGWKHGENVTSSGVTTDVWFHGAVSGNWFWAGGFTDAGTHDLADMNPVVVVPPPVTGVVTRTAGSVAVNHRAYPTTTDALVAPQLAPGASVNVIAFTHSQSVTQVGVTSDIWYQLEDTSWAWAGAFISQDTTGIAQVTAPTNTGNVLDPTMPWKKQTPDTPLATWIGSPNYNRYAANPVKDHITLHWMAGTLSGTDATFQNPGAILNGLGTGVATNYGIGVNAIHQYIKEANYQHGDGDRGSNTTGVSIEHEGGYALPDGTLAVPAKSTLDLSAKLVADIDKRYNLGKLVLDVNIFKHNHWVPTTTCPGTLDVDYIIEQANIINGFDTPPVVTPPATVPTDTTISDALAILLPKIQQLEIVNAQLLNKQAGYDAQVADLQAKLAAAADPTTIAALQGQVANLQAKLDAIRTALG